MSIATLENELLLAPFGASGRMVKTSGGYLIGWGTTVGNGLENWSPSALFLDTDASGNSQINVNVGTATTAVWETVSSS